MKQLQTHYENGDHSKAVRKWAEQIGVEGDRMDGRFDLFAFPDRSTIISDLSKATNRLMSLFSDAPKTVTSSLNTPRLLDRAILEVSELENKLQGMTSERVILTDISFRIANNIITNFQVPVFAGIKNSMMESLFTVSGIGGFTLLRDSISFDHPGNFFRLSQELHLQEELNPRIIYLESPIYWKLKGSLEDTGFYRTSNTADHATRLSGVPGHFIDLLAMLKHEYIGDMEFPEVHTQLTDKNIVGGKISISEQGDLRFQENDRNFSMHSTATGVANLGILALLIERKVLTKGWHFCSLMSQRHTSIQHGRYIWQNVFSSWPDKG